ncbi:hypothetical protein IH575_00345 [Candidatus Dojkabacteria bacterium]|nr:hypothetical protein [Candidatus Dojkabacteria bacterium]
MPIPVSLGSKGSTGAAEVTVTSTKIRVNFQGTGQQIDVLREDAPDYMISGKQIVSLSGDNNRIFSAKPSGGSYICKFIGFWSKNDEPPTPKKVPARSGVSKGKSYQIPEHLEFTALFEVQTGKWKRYQLSQNLFYAFSEYDGGITQIKGNGSKKLEEFLQVCGMDFVSDDIPFSENVLPYVEKMLLERGKKVIISVSPDGWVDSIVPAPDEGDEPEYVEEQVQETPAPAPDPMDALKSQLSGANPEEVAALLAQLGFEKK